MEESSNIDPNDFINGERIQQIADMYLGTADDFIYNPIIMEQIEKHQILADIVSTFDNPPILFLYTHLLKQFVDKLQYFANPFTLITHNSDTNLIESNPEVFKIIQTEKLVCWWGQNLCFIHPKMRCLPIGLANTMWDHGKIENFMNPIKKTDDVYFNFNIYTNREKRQPCFDALKYSFEFLPMVSVVENVKRLAKYRWCICPEGNGVDTHRIWEAIYMRCIPIVVKSPFIDALMHYSGGELPIYVINSWDDLTHLNLPNFEPFFRDKFDKWISLNYFSCVILKGIPM